MSFRVSSLARAASYGLFIQSLSNFMSDFSFQFCHFCGFLTVISLMFFSYLQRVFLRPVHVVSHPIGKL